MTNNDKKKREVGGVGRTSPATAVTKAAAVSEVDQIEGVKRAGAVSATKGAGKVRSTRLITLEEREQLLRLVQEEARALFGSADSERAKVAQEAVRMALDSSLLPKGEDIDTIDLFAEDVPPKKR